MDNSMTVIYQEGGVIPELANYQSGGLLVTNGNMLILHNLIVRFAVRTIGQKTKA